MERTINPAAEVAALIGRELTEQEASTVRGCIRTGMVNPYDIVAAVPGLEFAKTIAQKLIERVGKATAWSMTSDERADLAALYANQYGTTYTFADGSRIHVTKGTATPVRR